MVQNQDRNAFQLPSLHDWEIMGVTVNRFTNTAAISLYFPDEQAEAILILNGMQRFFLSEMKYQNVILDVLLFDAESESDYFQRSCQLLGMAPSNFEEVRGYKLIYIEPSVGAELACYFNDLEFINRKSEGTKTAQKWGHLLAGSGQSTDHLLK